MSGLVSSLSLPIFTIKFSLSSFSLFQHSFDIFFNHQNINDYIGQNSKILLTVRQFRAVAETFNFFPM